MKCGIIKKRLKIYFCDYKFQYQNQNIKVNYNTKGEITKSCGTKCHIINLLIENTNYKEKI